MNGFQSGKNSNLDKPFPGCLGRMVNLFDLNSGVAGNRMLTDKPHGSLSRSQSDVVRTYPSEDQIEENMIFSDLKRNSSNKKTNGTPMKKLIAQEMSKEINSCQNPPSVVAKLMGLDAFPMRRSVSAARSHFGGHSRSHTDSSFSYCQHENGSLMEEMHNVNQYAEQNEYKDVYEVRQPPTKINCGRSKSPQKAKDDETSIDKKVAFVRQKFIEAKCLSIDGKLRQSKEFQEALDVLSSNTDLFLKFLQEPNPMFSQHLHNLKSVPPPPGTKRITVLRPSKMVDISRFGESGNTNEKEMKRATQLGQGNRVDKSHCASSPPAAGWNIDENPAQPTRIVVLKPSPSKTHNCRTASSPPSASPRASETEMNFVNIEDNEAEDSGEVAIGITQKMRENLGGHRRDETLLSSVSSNGYIGDESSFNKSENEYVAGNHSDSEVISPVSRHSWDYINRFGGPYSCSSVSRASYSPESSVSKEAKKRLSERWAMVASNGSCQDQRHLRRNSSTLGEMLALSDTKKAGGIEQESSKEEPRTSNSNSMSNSNCDEGLDQSPRNLSRSKSVPVSSTAFGTQLHVDVRGPDTGKNNLPKDTTKPRSTKLSLKNLLFSRNKKPSKDGVNHLQSSDEMQSGDKSSHCSAKVDKDKIEYLNVPGLECSSADLDKSPGKLVSQNLFGERGIISPEVGLFVSKSLPSGNQCESQDQPSPISVLETTFEEDEHPTHISFGRTKPDHHGGELSVDPIRCNLIDKSPPIGSIARTLSWNDSCVDTASSVCLRPSTSIQRTEEEEKEWFSFVQTLLTVAGLNEVQSDAFLLMWHSPEGPLDPSLREKYVDLSEKDVLHEARRRQKRSIPKLVFDCVNAALMEIAGYGPDTCQRAIPYSGVSNNVPEGAKLILVDQVWTRMKEWFSSEMKCLSDDGGDGNSLVVDGMVRKEVVGRGWLQYLRLELDNVGMEIERKLLEELVHESIVELTGRV
ncbi:PREDICTED: uncharacterized protein LOC109215575 isoform X2 [Nicotiana attenuata]|uniref:DUF4378 domain-containing protein n=1 Tax=Nicotiana attenuata TaxID=49451 RepID=A0A1J6KA36_NICAT|nr:PREDICTED: uncharacterized protein LOC109215575 isoform X2 [Nicotiana attenuata]OIT26230.1 hypothetical protein A4A49_37856 [Nicotiana attenuata]